MAACVALIVACGGEKTLKVLTPEQTVQVCWDRIGKGDFAGAANLMYVEGVEKSVLAESIEANCGPLGDIAGKISFATTDVAVDGDVATVVGRVTLPDGRYHEAVYRLVKHQRTWLIAE